jgi:uncharacterized protein (TIGR03663 family)
MSEERTAVYRALGIERALSLPISLSWETLAYGAILALGAGLRLWGLGDRALHHDESLHAFFSWLLYRDGTYEHMPMMHGPLKFFTIALAFFLLGDGDAAARVPAALVGTALLALPILWRRRLGRAGALAVSLLLAVSPVMVYVSRFARDDMYTAFLTMALAILMWQYLDEGHMRHLVLLGLVMGLSFATMENTFIHLAIFLSFLEIWLAYHFWGQICEARGLGGIRAVVALVGLLFFAWVIVALWPVGRWRERLGLRRWHRAGDLMLVMGTLTAPQLAAAVQLPLAWMGIDDSRLQEVVWSHFLWFRNVTREQALGTVVVLALLLATALVGTTWRRSWWAVAAAFYVPFVLLYTTFFTHWQGLATGIWGSLDYWLAQHGYRRGDQPDFYYLVLLSAYEFLPLSIGGVALVYYSVRGGLASWMLSLASALSLLLFFGAKGDTGAAQWAFLVPVAAVAFFVAVQGDMFERFLCFWLAGSLFAYSFTGEKMPWLATHLALPLNVLAGYALGRWWERWRGSRQEWWAMTAAGLLWGGAAVWGALGPPGWVSWRALVTVAGGALALFILARRSLAAIPLMALAPLAVLTLRATVMVSFQNGDVPREMMVYTQTSPAVADVARRIERWAEETGVGRDLPVVVDTTYAWPWQWYLRHYRNLHFVSGGQRLQLPEGAVVILALENAHLMDPYLAAYQEPYRHPLRWWFPEVYRGIDKGDLVRSVRGLLGDMGRASTWRNWWRYLLWREPPAPVVGTDDVRARCPWCGSVDEVLYMPKASPWPLSQVTVPTITVRPAKVLSPVAPDGRGLQGATGLAPGPEGSIYVADTANGRLLRLEGEKAQVVADGLKQPADLRVAADGTIYALDTWNHRAVAVTPRGEVRHLWGRPASSLDNPDLTAFWGPRAIALDHQGQLLISDTGTGRIIRLSPQGELLRIAGGLGRQEGRFLEPTGLAPRPDGGVWVADVGNARLQLLGPDLEPLQAVSVTPWRTSLPGSHPYMALLPDGRLVTEAFAPGRLLILGPDGRLQAMVHTDPPLMVPQGLAVVGDLLYVMDSGSGLLLALSIADLAMPRKP